MDIYENNKILKCDGVINRRNFIINVLIIMIISEVIFTTPAIFYMFYDLDFLQNIITIKSLPLFFVIWVILEGFCKFLLYIPSVIKRIRDILGENRASEIKVFTYCVIGFMFISIFSIIFTDGIGGILKWVQLFIMIFLMCAKGKITGQKPKSEVYKFNWGAFFGTWLWGLFNKAYKTLWMIPLFFTTAIFPFMILCGLKGNEWSYKKSNNSAVEDFHKSQSRQAIIWGILFPIILMAYSLITFFVAANLINDYLKLNPQYLAKFQNIISTQQITLANDTFSKIELTENEYKFYINPKLWNSASKRYKISIFNNAQAYVFYKNNKETDNSLDSVQPEILSKIKIYSDYNNELLAECKIDKILIEQINAKSGKSDMSEIMKQINSSYVFNYHPSLP